MPPALDDYRALVREIGAQQAMLSSSSWFFDGADRLRLTTFGSVASVTLAIEGRMLDLEGHPRPFARPHTPASDRTAATELLDVGAGFLLNVAIRATAGTPRRGQVYAILEVVRGLGATVQPVGVLWQGYVTDTTPAGWPGVVSSGPTEGPGVIRSVTGSNPAAAAEIVETVPANARWRLLSFRAELVADANAANRTVTLSIDDGTTTLLSVTASAAQTAGLTRQYQAWANGGAPRLDGTVFYLPIAPCLELMGGFRLQTTTANIQVGDNWAAPQLLVEEWIED